MSRKKLSALKRYNQLPASKTNKTGRIVRKHGPLTSSREVIFVLRDSGRAVFRIEKEKIVKSMSYMARQEDDEISLMVQSSKTKKS